MNISKTEEDGNIDGVVTIVALRGTRTGWTQEGKVHWRKYHFVTFVLSRIQLSTGHRKKREEAKGKTPETPKIPMFTRAANSMYNHAEMAMWTASGSMANFHREQSSKIRLEKFSKILHSWWKGVAKSILNIVSSVRHVYRKDNQEADH